MPSISSLFDHIINDSRRGRKSQAYREARKSRSRDLRENRVYWSADRENSRFSDGVHGL